VGLSSNFDATVHIDGEELTVGGSSQGLDGGKLVSRHVALHQEGNVVEGPATASLKWAAEPPLDSSGFQEGDALAIGCESYFVQGDAALPTFATVTWSQIVKVEGK
jgi:hypothetical protein